MPDPLWHDLGLVADLAQRPLQQITIGRTRIALSHRDGEFAAISGACNHVGGPLGDGRLDGEYVVCPWHNMEITIVYVQHQQCSRRGHLYQAVQAAR
ncbi:MAG: Rieske (2Fe-2S) protein [Myxococcales bacterium]|nr:Rieske (2Fe-2S) protein [Myxococcales bacterium]